MKKKNNQGSELAKYGLIALISIILGILVGIQTTKHLYVSKTQCLEIIHTTSAYSFGYGYGVGETKPYLQSNEIYSFFTFMTNDIDYQEDLINLKK